MWPDASMGVPGRPGAEPQRGDGATVRSGRARTPRRPGPGSRTGRGGDGAPGNQGTLGTLGTSAITRNPCPPAVDEAERQVLIALAEGCRTTGAYGSGGLVQILGVLPGAAPPDASLPLHASLARFEPTWNGCAQ
ncbi:hypothetical protein GCM10010347_43160 [Streptomyces cirratus]|uniref:Uncharacterized protein n=1 Tax=Streptomyces cirratus TaxID=68187 RepID=A0ABQ3F0V5_9ACTN|nr:hypothetical protein GCM10010347_43160 [Streptomyces cirratus]